MENTESAAPGPPTGDRPSPADLFELAAERALDDSAGPAERAAMITELLKAVERWQRELTETRRTDVLTLRETMTLAKVGAAIGLSVPRVDQIAKGK